LFNIFINDILLKLIIPHADDLKIYRNTKSAEDCKALQVDTDAVQQWCSENGMELNIQKIKIISFTRKTNGMLDSKLYFHCYVDFVYSQALRTLQLIRFITYNSLP
jgi:hypothetical protein